MFPVSTHPFLKTTIKEKRSLAGISSTSTSLFLVFLVLINLSQNCIEANKNDSSPENYNVKYHIRDRLSKNIAECESNNTLADGKVFQDIKNEKRQIENGNCDTIHLAVICGGYNSTRSFYVLLKSILFYRTDTIHLHLLVDKISHKILTELFKTWIIPDLIISYYNATNYEQEISWIPSHHYSHRFGLMKLVFLTALGKEGNLSKVIVLDTDLLVLGDIEQAWRRFEKFILTDAQTAGQVFGMVENQSGWYLGDNNLSKERMVWPALGRGFNSGLILVNLVELESQSWSHLWRYVTETELTSHLSTSLADQDVFNAVIKSNEHMIHRLPCVYNLQLNDHTDLNEICPIQSGLKIIHWNSPNKLESKNAEANYYKDWYFTFQNWDGKLLERSFHSFPTTKGYTGDTLKNKTLQDQDYVCQDIQPRPDVKLRTYLYFMDFELEQIENDVTLVVHLSLDRLLVLDELASRWHGPISAAIYLSELETNLLSASILNSINLWGRKNIGFHLAFRDRGFSYPINKLRNIALRNSLTPYIFLSDIDFLPPANLYNYLRQTLSEMTVQSTNNPLSKRVLVVPAFENLQYKFDYPSGKIELLTQLDMGSISVFREQIWPQGHAATDYARWRVSSKPYHIMWQPEYEPFIVTSNDVPNFDERFVGFGWNKVEHITLLAAMQYEFVVLPEAFVIHKLHAASYDIMKHRESYKYRTCIKKMRKLFLTELKTMYPNFFKNISLVNKQRSLDRLKA